MVGLAAVLKVIELESEAGWSNDWVLRPVSSEVEN